jgi:recombination protein RecA
MVKKLDAEVKKMSKEEKLELLKGELGLINKKYKKEVLTFGHKHITSRIPFKSDALNIITSGGVPTGRFSVIWGGKGCTKTTQCYDLVANAQKMDKTCLWVDFERSFDKDWATLQGVNVDELIMAPIFDNAEVAMDTIISLTKTKAIDLIILDSVQGLSPVGEQETKKGVEKSLTDDTMALLARKLSQFFRMSSAKVYESDCTVVLIGQTRMDLGGFITFEKLSGGHALEHWSSMTIQLRRGAKVDAPKQRVKNEDGSTEEVLTGFNVVAKVNKSKVGPDENKECHITFKYGIGITND